jgi:hypothetical protein
MKNIFDKQFADAVILRIENLQITSQPLWGKMSVDQMLAHCNVTYAYTYQPEKFKKPNFLKRFLLKTFVKNMVVSEKPYAKNLMTAPEFKMAETKNFEKEKNLLIENILKTQQLGANYFNGKENFSFGKLTATEWNNLFYKHLHHHLTQFGV